MIATKVFLVLGTAFLFMGVASEVAKSESCEDALEYCESESMKVERKLIEFKFKILELQGKLNTMNVLNDTKTLLEGQLKSSEESLAFCRSVSPTTTGNNTENQVILMEAQPSRYRRIGEKYPTSCVPNGFNSGVRTIQFVGAEPFSVYCDGDTAGPGWTVIQQRIDGSVDFYKNWTEYVEGFGDVTAEHFIGLQKLYLMTSFVPHELYIQLTAFSGEVFFAHYQNFLVGNELEKYMLKKLGKMTGNVANKLADHLGHKFSTYDQDNDNATENIAVKYHGGWWYYESKSHYGCNLNGLYKTGESDDLFRLHWQWTGYKHVKMLIRPKTQ